MFTMTTATLALAAGLLGTPAVATAPTSQYKLVTEHSHPNFFDGFTLFDQGDPTLGAVKYVDFATAKDNDLIGWIYHEDTQSSNAFIGLDYHGKNVSNRNSVRLTGKQTYSAGTLTVIDVRHIPTGPSLWPAVWYLAPQAPWPDNGEMDIMEWVNDNTYNSMTLHTGEGCTVANSPADYLGNLLSTDCHAKNGSEGCSIPAPLGYKYDGKTVATAGPQFNSQGGGIYVHEWTPKSISVWLFPRDSMPQDLKNGNPNPSSWTQKPLAKFSGSGCDLTKAFSPQQLIINIDVCGSWTGKAFKGHWATDDNWNHCVDYAANNPEEFKDAYFEFESIKMYSSNSGATSKREIGNEEDFYVYGTDATEEVADVVPDDQFYRDVADDDFDVEGTDATNEVRDLEHADQRYYDNGDEGDEGRHDEGYGDDETTITVSTVATSTPHHVHGHHHTLSGEPTQSRVAHHHHHPGHRLVHAHLHSSVIVATGTSTQPSASAGLLSNSSGNGTGYATPKPTPSDGFISGASSSVEIVSWFAGAVALFIAAAIL